MTVSVVSHGQIELVNALLGDLAAVCRSPLEVVLTQNTPEPALDRQSVAFDLKVIQNKAPKGFGANHNAAFAISRGSLFFVVNPDVRLTRDPFPMLAGSLSDPGVGAAAPRVVSAEGRVEDSARRFPTPGSILAKAMGLRPEGAGYPMGEGAVDVDWVAGMFMGFRREVFAEAGGFDERYFLYYEDVDLCARLRAAGYRIRWEPEAEVIHNARRSSHRNLRFLFWHLRSMTRYFLTTGKGAAVRH
jgi:GT2 family glycosyltransferase